MSIVLVLGLCCYARPPLRLRDVGDADVLLPVTPPLLRLRPRPSQALPRLSRHPVLASRVSLFSCDLVFGFAMSAPVGVCCGAYCSAILGARTAVRSRLVAQPRHDERRGRRVVWLSAQ